MDKQILHLVTAVRIGSITWSDHAPVSIEITLDPRMFPSSPWRPNSHIITDPKHAEIVRQALVEYFATNTGSVANHQVVWLSHKATIIGTLIALVARVMKERIKKFKTWHPRLRD